MAASGRLRESWSVLSRWTTSSSDSWFRVSLAGKGSMARAKHGINSAVDVVSLGDMFNQMEETGSLHCILSLYKFLFFVSS